jgi:hypothetical protein
MLCGGMTAFALAPKTKDTNEIPPDFPKDFPIYPNATVVSYGPILPSNPTLGNVLVLRTLERKTTVLDFYKLKLRANGWSLRTFSGAPDSLAASKGERRISVNVTEPQESDKHSTLIQLTVNEIP